MGKDQLMYAYLWQTRRQITGKWRGSLARLPNDRWGSTESCHDLTEFLPVLISYLVHIIVFWRATCSGLCFFTYNLNILLHILLHISKFWKIRAVKGFLFSIKSSFSYIHWYRNSRPWDRDVVKYQERKSVTKIFFKLLNNKTTLWFKNVNLPPRATQLQFSWWIRPANQCIWQRAIKPQCCRSTSSSWRCAFFFIKYL